MQDLPAQRLDPNMRNVWRLSGGLALTAAAAGVGAAAAFLAWLLGLGTPALALGVVACAWLVALVAWVAVAVPVRYARWGYELTPEHLCIAHGVVWRTRTVVPFVRVQNTDTRQGPILRLFGLSSVTVATAAGEHVIPGLGHAEACELRDRAAEFARLAREDV